MRGVRKLEAQNIAPKCERTLKIRNSDTGVIGGNAKLPPLALALARAHAPDRDRDPKQTSNAQRPTSNGQR